ncbi:hypothetical protein V8V69_20795, partial [Niallia circulans]
EEVFLIPRCKLFGTLGIAQGFLFYKKKRLGHKNYQVTVDTYSHISKKIEENSLSKFENHINNVLGKI